jgi:uncharacterized integral membrane protein (TIGR02327 family)
VAGFGVYAAIYLFIHILTLIVTWWAIQTVKFDTFLKNPNGPRAKILMILITIAISYLVGEFFVNYLNRSMELPNF